MATIEVKDFILGGLADSEYFGSKNSVYELVGFDIHSFPGKLVVNQKLTKDSPDSGTAIIDDFVKTQVVCSDGNTYLFGSTNGKIWKRNDSGTYSLEATASPTSGTAGILSAEEYQGYIYYAMQNSLGRVAVGSPTVWSGKDDNWATFTNGDDDFHPIIELNLILYIGDGDLIAQVNETTFTANALDIPQKLRVSALGAWNTDLLVGTYVQPTVLKTQLLRWNTWSESWSYMDPIPEVGINAFLDTDNEVVVSAGTKGHIYTYDGYKLVSKKKLPGDFPRGTANKCKVHSGSVLNFHNVPLFGMSQVSDNAIKYGIYSIARHSANYPQVTAFEYQLSVADTEDLEIGSIEGVGDVFLVAWKYSGGASVEYGIDILDLSAKQTEAYFTTRWMIADRREPLSYGQVDVAYASLPTNTDIKIERKFGDTGTFGEVDSIDNSISLLKSTKTRIGDTTKAMIRVTATSSGNDAPEIESAFIDVVNTVYQNKSIKE